MTEANNHIVEIPEPIDLAQFEAIENSLSEQLSDRLQEEMNMSAFEIDESSDLYEGTPVVDSKTVVMLSPLVEKMTGRKIDVKWIKRGGYNSREEAVSEIMAKIREACEV